MRKIKIKQKQDIYYGSEFYLDLKILFKEKLNANTTVVLLTGIRSFRETDNYTIIKNLLLEKMGVEIIKEVQVNSNPKWSEIVSFERVTIDVDFIICIGGGSVIDFGKALKLNFYQSAKIFAIYTLIGSASIVTPFVIFDNNEFKIGKHSNEIVPDYVYINKEILLCTTNDLIKSGSFDVLAHIVESFVSKSSTKESRRYALKALGFLFNYVNSESADIFSLLKADIFAGLSEQIGLVLFPHAAGHYVTYKYKVPHTLATMYFLKKFVTILSSKGYVFPPKMMDLINIFDADFIKEFKIPLQLTGKDIQKSYSMTEKYMPFTFVNNPIQLSKDDYFALYNL